MRLAALPLDEFAVEHHVRSLGHANLKAYQDWYGLKPDGVIGPKTSTVLMRGRCGVPDFVGGPAEAQWPRSCVEVPVTYSFDRINAALAERCWKEALGTWNRVCGIKLQLKIGGANNGKIWATDGPLPGGTLAWSFLANDRCDTRLEQRYDTEEVPYSFEFLTKIIFHEVGHALGLEHSNRQDDIMFPSISNKPWSDYPSANDIARVVQRYGKATDPPPPEPPGPTPPSDPGSPATWKVEDGFVRVNYGTGSQLIYFKTK